MLQLHHHHHHHYQHRRDTVTSRGMAPTPPFFLLAVLAVLFAVLSTASGNDSNVDYTGAVHAPPSSPPSSTPTALC